MVSVGISKLDLADLIFVDPWVKINGGYYSDVLLSGNFFIFQQDSTPTTPGTWKMCDFLNSEHPLSILQICGHRIAPTSVWSITRYGVTSSNKCFSCSCTALTNWRSVFCTFGTTSWTIGSLMTQVMSGISVFERVHGQKADNWAIVVNLTIAVSAEPYDKRYTSF